MYITFKNYCTDGKILISAGNRKYTVNPESSLEIFHSGNKFEFEAQTSVFDEFLDTVNEIDEKDKNDSLKDRILTSLTKKFFKKVTEGVLNLSLKYEVTFDEGQTPVINFFEGAYSFFDGEIADVFDMTPIAMVFPRAETDSGQIRVTDVESLNRKKYLRLWRNILLFANWGFFLDLFFFIPEYLIAKIFSADFFIKRILTSLYNKSPMERERILADKERKYDSETSEAGCLTYILKGLIVLLILIGIVVWAGGSE